ncbi:MAG: glutamate 5-kinase [Anaerolineae bacterium]|nr:glutamate 5-kinase [Anaerolineae bacterium]
MPKTIVVKIGTSTLTQGTKHLSRPMMLEIVRQLATLHHEGHHMILVTSGAMAAGRELLKQNGFPAFLPVKQMLCAVGQSQLMRLYTDLFALYDVQVGQVLITGDDLRRHRTRYLNARDTLNTLLVYGIVPIINENDTVAVEEIKVGDNDNLSALIASIINADLLLLLTDCDGLYDKDPRQHPDARRMEVVIKIDDTIRGSANGTSSSGLGIGGMQTKIQAAELAGRSGIETVIANGSTRDIILRIVEGESLGTRFLPPAPRVESRKRWLLSEPPQGKLTIDSGAGRVLLSNGASLLPVGVRQVEGHFSRGAIVAILDASGTKMAHGLTNYDSEELRRLCGMKSDRIEAILGYTYGDEAVHRDNLALLQREKADD